MILNASFQKHFLQFKKPAGTSRGWLTEKPCWFIRIKDTESGIEGVGECSIIPGLSIEDEANYEEKIIRLCDEINTSGKAEVNTLDLGGLPSIRFGLEAALLDLKNGGGQVYFRNDFSLGKTGIPINGLVWMAGTGDMHEQAIEKINAGYEVIKLKVGALDFESEFTLLSMIRDNFPDITIRIDANGAFSASNAMEKLEKLATINIHSIEQPIKSGQWDMMKKLCAESPISIALDEELIGINSADKKMELLDYIIPQYIILKPSILGGFAACDEWISLAEKRNIGWWITSALESNIGLNAIAQWTATKNVSMAQGLGTGSLYTNNVESGLYIERGELFLSSP